MPIPQPTPPSPPPTPAVAPVIAQGAMAEVPPSPATALELSALKARRTELSNQLQSAASRREQLAHELRNPMVSGADRTGLEERLRLLDQRILKLESDIAVSGQQLANAPGRLVATARVSETFGGLPGEGVLAVGGLVTLTVLAPLSIAAARLMWRRARRPAIVAPQAVSIENSPRLDRLENAVDAIAVELERVAEGQRFVTRLMAQSHGIPTLAAEDGRAPEPLPAVAGDARRGER